MNEVTSKEKLGTFTIGRETFTLSRVVVEYTSFDGPSRLVELWLDSDQKSPHRPKFWYGDRVSGHAPGDDCMEGAFRFYTMRGNALRRKGREVQVLVSGDVFSVA